jgi:hypothetical protein
VSAAVTTSRKRIFLRNAIIHSLWNAAFLISDEIVLPDVVDSRQFALNTRDLTQPIADEAAPRPEIPRRRRCNSLPVIDGFWKLARFPTCSSLPGSFTLITRTAPCLRQLPSCVAVYPRDSRSRRVDAPLAQLRTATLRGLTVYPSPSQPDVFYVADPVSSIRARRRPLP